MVKNIKIIASGILILFGLGSSGQTHEEYINYKEKYPDAQLVYLSYEKNDEIVSKGDSLQIISGHYQDRIHLGAQSNLFNNGSIYSSHFVRILKHKAFTKVFNKRKYKNIPVEDFKESFDRNSDNFYDDSKYLVFNYPSVEVGAHTVLEYEQLIIDPHFTGKFFFGNNSPSEKMKFSVTVPKNVEVEFSIYNDPENQIRQTVRKEGGKIIYEFQKEDVPSYFFESNSPSIYYLTPHVSYRIISHNVNGKTHPILPDVAGLYQWYRTFLEAMDQEDDELIKEQLTEIISPEDSELEKAKKIFYWVQKNIKYIAFEDGMRGFVPHSGAYVCTKKYGDCKDMASITVSLLKQAGLDAHYTWVGTRDLPYTYEEMPTPSADNHMIAYFELNGEKYFLDATSQYVPFDMPSAMIQGKDVLISKGNEFELQKVPEIDAEKNYVADTVMLKLSNELLEGEGVVHFEGFFKVNQKFNFNRSTQTEQYERIKSRIEKGNNKFKLSNYSISNMDSYESPLIVNYDFEIPDYVSVIGDRIFVNLNMEKIFNKTKYPLNRKQPVEFDFKNKMAFYAKLEIPEDYELSSIPEDVHYETQYFVFSTQYKRTGESVIISQTAEQKLLMLEPDLFPEYNEWANTINNSMNEVLILKKKQ